MVDPCSDIRSQSSPTWQQPRLPSDASPSPPITNSIFGNPMDRIAAAFERIAAAVEKMAEKK